MTWSRNRFLKPRYFRREPTGTSSRNPASTGVPSGDGRRDDHAVGLHAAQLARLQIHDDHDLAADQLFGLIRSGDSGDDLADFVADVDHTFSSLSAPATRSADFTWPTRISTLAKSSMVMRRSLRRAAAAAALQRRAPRPELAAGADGVARRALAVCSDFLFHGCNFLQCFGFFHARKYGAGSPIARAGTQSAPSELIDAHLSRARQTARVAAKSFPWLWARRDAPAPP